MKKEVIFRAKYPFPENEIVLNTVNMPEKSEQVFFITINNESYGEAYCSVDTTLWQYVLNTLTEFDHEYEEVRQYFDNGSDWDEKYKKIIYRYLEIFNVETIKISELIKNLMIAMNELGDIPVIHSRDEEGNSYNTIKLDSISYMDTDKTGRVLVLYPFEEYINEQLFNNN